MGILRDTSQGDFLVASGNLFYVSSGRFYLGRDSMIKLYDYFFSGAAYRTRIALNLKGLEYEQEAVHLTKDGGEQFQAEYDGINPQNLVPTLIDNERTFFQSMAIMEYLEEAYAEPALLPQDQVGRARVPRLERPPQVLHPPGRLVAVADVQRAAPAEEEEDVREQPLVGRRAGARPRGRRHWRRGLGALRRPRGEGLQAQRRAPERPRGDDGHHWLPDPRAARRRRALPDGRLRWRLAAAGHRC